MHSYMHVHACMLASTHVQVNMHAEIHARTRTHAYVHPFMHTSTYVCINTHTYTYAYTYTYTYTETYTYIHIYIYTYPPSLASWPHPRVSGVGGTRAAELPSAGRPRSWLQAGFRWEMTRASAPSLGLAEWVCFTGSRTRHSTTRYSGN